MALFNRQPTLIPPSRKIVGIAMVMSWALLIFILGPTATSKTPGCLVSASSSPSAEQQHIHDIEQRQITITSKTVTACLNKEKDDEERDDDDSCSLNCSIDDDQSYSSSQGLNLMILSEPSPVTYMSGQSARFRSLLEYLSRHQRKTGDTTVLVTSASSSQDDNNVHPTSCFDDTIPIQYTWGFSLPQYPALTLGLDITNKVWRLCKEQRKQRADRTFDLIHVSTPGLLVFPAIVASRWHGIPLVMSYHTHLPSYIPIYYERWPRIVQRFLTWLSWRLIIGAHKMFGHVTVVTSTQIANEFQSHGYTHDESLVVWPKGVDTTQFHPRYNDETMRRRMMGLPVVRDVHDSDSGNNTLLLVYIGRLGKEKRLKDLKAILEGIERRFDDNDGTDEKDDEVTGTLSRRHRRQCIDSVRLCIVGSGPEEEELHRYFNGTNTTFLGSLEGLPLSQAYASADVFVMPSDTETLGFVVMEAMASGVPVVGCKAGGLLDLIQDNTTGFLVPIGCIDEFVDKIWTLSQDDGLYDRLSSNGLEASKDWSWESSMDFMRCQVYPDAIRRFRQDRCQRRRRRQFWGWPILSLGWRREPKAARGEDIMPPERM